MHKSDLKITYHETGTRRQPIDELLPEELETGSALRVKGGIRGRAYVVCDNSLELLSVRMI